MAACFATLMEKEIRQMKEEATAANTKSTCLVNTKTAISPSVSVPGDLDIATRFGKYQSLVTSTSGDSC